MKSPMTEAQRELEGLAPQEQYRLEHYQQQMARAGDVEFEREHAQKEEPEKPPAPAPSRPYHSTHRHFTDEEWYEPEEYESAEDFYEFWSEDFADFYDAEDFYNEYVD